MERITEMDKRKCLLQVKKTDIVKAGIFLFILNLYASWGVDSVKVDDLSRPYHADEIDMIRKAIDQTGRPMVFSISPGATPIDEHVQTHRLGARLYRI